MFSLNIQEDTANIDGLVISESENEHGESLYGLVTENQVHGY